MTRMTLFAAALAAFAPAGCVLLPTTESPPKPAEPFPAARPPVVLPEQVTDANAREKADQLKKEMEFDAQAPAGPAFKTP